MGICEFSKNMQVEQSFTVIGTKATRDILKGLPTDIADQLSHLLISPIFYRRHMRGHSYFKPVANHHICFFGEDRRKNSGDFRWIKLAIRIYANQNISFILQRELYSGLKRGTDASISSM